MRGLYAATVRKRLTPRARARGRARVRGGPSCVLAFCILHSVFCILFLQQLTLELENMHPGFTFRTWVLCIELKCEVQQRDTSTATLGDNNLMVTAGENEIDDTIGIIHGRMNELRKTWTLYQTAKPYADDILLRMRAAI